MVQMKSHRHIVYVWTTLAILLMFASCRPGIPADVLSESKMVDILFEIHVAQAMTEVSGVLEDNRDVVALRSAVLKKYGVSQEEYDRSYNFYCTHAEYLNEIYADLSEKMKENVLAIGGKVQGIETNEADTANVWNMEPSIILLDKVPYNKVSFDVLPDSTFKTGDRINLQYDTQMMVQEGSRDVIACLNVFYTNSTSASKVSHINSDGKGIITVSNDTLDIKKVTGFFMIAPPNETEVKKTQFRLFVLKDIKLLHLPTTKSDKSKQQETSSIDNNDEQQEQNTDQE